MKIVVIGGTGLIGSNVVSKLRERGHDVLAASPNSGVNTITGEGLAQALAGAQVVVDVSNSPSFEDKAVLEFFETSGRNLLAAERIAGVLHHVALSIVGADRLPDSGYLRAKVAQEGLVKSSGIPFTILRSTQFFEFMGRMADSSVIGNSIQLPSALMQPILSGEVSATLADIAASTPKHGTLEIGGPDRWPIDEIVRHLFKSTRDMREVVTDIHARYFGTELTQTALVPSEGAIIGRTHFTDWLNKSTLKAPTPKQIAAVS